MEVKRVGTNPSLVNVSHRLVPSGSIHDDLLSVDSCVLGTVLKLCSLCCLSTLVFWELFFNSTLFAACRLLCSGNCSSILLSLLPVDSCVLGTVLQFYSLCCLSTLVFWELFFNSTLFAACRLLCFGNCSSILLSSLPVDSCVLGTVLQFYSLCCLSTLVFWELFFNSALFTACRLLCSGNCSSILLSLLPVDSCVLGTVLQFYSLCCLSTLVFWELQFLSL